MGGPGIPEMLSPTSVIRGQGSVTSANHGAVLRLPD